MGHLEGNFTPVLYVGRKVPKGSYPNTSEVCLVTVSPNFCSVISVLKTPHTLFPCVPRD